MKYRPKAYELILFTLIIAGLMLACALGYNEVVPAYQ